MAPLPESNTARVFLTYQVHERQHTMMARYDGLMSDGALSEAIGALLDAFTPLVKSSQFVKFEKAASGSNVRVPATWSGPTEWGVGAGIPTNAPHFYSCTGKDIEGRRFRLELFGRERGEGDGWRTFVADSTDVSNILDALNTTEPIFLSIAGSQPFYNQYINLSTSQHWIGEERT